MTIDCDAFDEVADELALGVLTGVDRAAALAHVDECHDCRAKLAALTEIADDVLLLAPSIAPDDGFEQRVLARIAGPEKHRAPRRRNRLVALAAAAIVAIMLAVVALAGHVGGGPAVPVAEMRTPGGAVVGTVSLHKGAPTTIDMRLPGWEALLRSYSASSRTRYWLALDARDGRHVQIALDPAGAGAWHVESTAVDVTSVAVVDAHGLVWCRARFA